MRVPILGAMLALVLFASPASAGFFDFDWLPEGDSVSRECDPLHPNYTCRDGHDLPERERSAPQSEPDPPEHEQPDKEPPDKEHDDSRT